MPRICSSVPYSSSSPCTASTGQAMVAISASMFQCAERRAQPDVVPAPEGRVGVVVVAREARAQVGRLVGVARLLDARDRDVLDEDVRRHHDDAGRPDGARRAAARSSRRRCGRRARAARCRACAKQRRQHLVRLAVHEVGRPSARRRGWRRAAVAVAREDEAAQAVLARRTRAGSPSTSRASRGLRAGRRRPAPSPRGAPTHACSISRRAAAPVEPRRAASRRSRRGHDAAPRRSRSRRRKRWILPVAVFGSSSTNSIARGYL